MNKKINVLLVCGTGASTSFMAAKMRIAAKKMGIDLTITARSESEISNYIGDVDAIMIGPHLAQEHEVIKDAYPDEVVVIPMRKDYFASLDGEKAIEHLLEELNNNFPD